MYSPKLIAYRASDFCPGPMPGQILVVASAAGAVSINHIEEDFENTPFPLRNLLAGKHKREDVS